MPCKHLSTKLIQILLILSCIFSLLSIDASSKGTDSTKNTISLLKHLEMMIEKGVWTSRLTPIFSILKSPKHARKLSRMIYSVEELIEPVACIDWRHTCFIHDYAFDGIVKKRDSGLYRQAAETYQKVVRIAKILEKACEDQLVKDCYLECWLTASNTVVNKIINQQTESHTIISIDKDKVYDFVPPGKDFPGIVLSNTRTLKNTSNLPVFVISVSDPSASLLIECIEFNSTQCQCGQWCDWTQPLYSYSLVSSLWNVNPGLLGPFSPEFLHLLAVLMSKRSEKGTDGSSKILYNLIGWVGSAFYNSGLQLLKDLWPGSQLLLSSFVEGALSKELNLSTYTIFKVPSVDSKSILSNSGLELNQSDFQHYNIFRPLTRVYTNDNSGPSYYYKYNSYTSYKDAIFPAYVYENAQNDFQKYLINYLKEGLELPKDVKEKQLFTAITWIHGNTKQPKPTLYALCVLSKLVHMGQDYTDQYSTCANSNEDHESAYSMSLAHLVLFGHLFSEISPDSRYIWLDSIKHGCCITVLRLSQVIRLSKNDMQDEDSEKWIEFSIPLYPFPFGLIKAEGLVLLYKFKEKYFTTQHKDNTSNRLICSKMTHDGFCVYTNDKINNGQMTHGVPKIVEIPYNSPSPQSDSLYGSLG